VSLEAVCENEELLREHVLPVTAALPGWDALYVDEATEAAVKNGIAVKNSDARTQDGLAAEWEEGKQVFICDAAGTPLALAQGRCQQDTREWVLLRGLWA
jgi:hypothetical protein